MITQNFVPLADMNSIENRPSSLLPDWMIKNYIHIDPYAEGEKRPGIISYGCESYGYNARLGNKFRVFRPLYSEVGLIDPKNFRPELLQEHEGDYCIIPPNSYALAESMEYFEIPRDILCVCLGKSTIARCGLIVNVTPLEPEWKGRVTIEISNSASLPAKIYAHEGIMQILFFRALANCERSYADKDGIYANQTGLTLPKVRSK